jgi:hypothetical protein
MTHEIYRVTAFQIVGPYKLQITFDDRTVQTIDFEPVLAGEFIPATTRPSTFQSGSTRRRSSYPSVAKRR